MKVFFVCARCQTRWNFIEILNSFENWAIRHEQMELRTSPTRLSNSNNSFSEINFSMLPSWLMEQSTGVFLFSLLCKINTRRSLHHHGNFVINSLKLRKQKTFFCSFGNFFLITHSGTWQRILIKTLIKWLDL